MFAVDVEIDGKEEVLATIILAELPLYLADLPKYTPQPKEAANNNTTIKTNLYLFKLLFMFAYYLKK